MNNSNERPQTFGEEIANSISHGVGMVGAVAAAPVLIVTAAHRGGTTDIVGASVFAASVVLLYCASCIYHAVPWERAKEIFRRIDHSAIFLFIAGTYTPFTLGVLRGPLGWGLFAAVWSIAAVGVYLKTTKRLTRPAYSLALYVIMGWMIVIAAGPLIERVPASGLALIGAGGLAYMIGVGFFANDSRLRYGHFVWHLFVVTGTVCHFFAVLWYSSPTVA